MCKLHTAKPEPKVTAGKNILFKGIAQHLSQAFLGVGMSRHSCHEGCWNIYCLEGLERQWRPANIHHHIARCSGCMLNCTVYITQVLWAQSSNTKRCAWEHSYSGPVSFHGMLIKFPEKKLLNRKGLFGSQFKGRVHQGGEGTMTRPGHMGPQLASKAQWVIMLILHSPLYPVWDLTSWNSAPYILPSQLP